MRSRLRVAVPQSGRMLQVNELSTKIKGLKYPQYIVVHGPKGVGKSCIIATATQKLPGVVNVRVVPKGTHFDYTLEALRTLCNFGVSTSSFVSPELLAPFVLGLYSCIPGAGRPTVIFEVGELKEGEVAVPMHRVAREIAKFNVTVIVDASTNSLAVETSDTERHQVMEVDPMSWEEIRSLPQLKDVISIVQRAGLEDVLLEVIGGVPASWERLAAMLEIVEEDKVAPIVLDFLFREISGAVEKLGAFIDKNPEFKEVCKQFVGKDVQELQVKDLKKDGTSIPKLPQPCKVLRKVVRDSEDGTKKLSMVPVNGVMAFVLLHGIEDPPESLERLQQLLKSKRQGQGH